MDAVCKMVCTEKTDRISQLQQNKVKTSHVKLATAPSEPAGSIEIEIKNPSAIDAFVLGQQYVVRFSPATAAAEANAVTI